MTQISDLRAIMESLPEEPEAVVEEQDEQAKSGKSLEETTDVEEDLRKWHEMEDEQVDREPQELDFTYDD
jgi:hypothetical protein